MKSRVLIGIEYFLIASLIPFLIVPQTLIGNVVYLSMGFISFAIFELLYIRYKNIEVTYKKSETNVAVVLTVLFIIMLSIFDILNSGFLDIDNLLNVYPSTVAHVIQVWGYIIYLPSVFVASFIFVWSMVHFALDNTEGGYHKATYKWCLIIISLLSVIYLFSTYPGIWIQDDVSRVWNQVCEQNWNAWDTLGYELFVALCAFLRESSFTVNVIQTILWIFLNSYILKVLQEESTKNMKIYTAVLVFVAAPFNYLEVMYKDVVFSMGILAITVGIYHIIKKKSIVWQDILVLTIGGAFASLCRHAGNVAVMLALVSVLGYFLIKKQKKICKYLIGITVFQVCLFLLVNVVLMDSLNATENPAYIKYTMPMVTIGAAASHGVEFESEDAEILERIMPIEEWGNCYNKYWADDLARGWGKIGGRINTVSNLIDTEQYGKDLLRINIKLLVNHPYIYVKSIFDMNNIVWKMARPNGGYEMAICTVTKNEQITYLIPFKYTDLWTQFMCNMPLTNVLYARGGVALFTILFSGVIWIIQKKRYFLIVLVPIIVYDCMLLITIPAQDPRFILPGIECAIFLAAVVFGADKDKNIA